MDRSFPSSKTMPQRSMCSYTMRGRRFSLWVTFILGSSSTPTPPSPDLLNFCVEQMLTSKLTCSSSSGLVELNYVLRVGRLAGRGARATPWVHHPGLKVTSSSSLDYLFTPTRRRLSNGLPIVATVLFANSGELIPICYTVLLLRSMKLSVLSPTTPKLLQMPPSRSPSATLLVGGLKSRGTPISKRSPRGGSSMRRSLSLMV